MNVIPNGSSSTWVRWLLGKWKISEIWLVPSTTSCQLQAKSTRESFTDLKIYIQRPLPTSLYRGAWIAIYFRFSIPEKLTWLQWLVSWQWWKVTWTSERLEAFFNYASRLSSDQTIRTNLFPTQKFTKI